VNETEGQQTSADLPYELQSKMFDQLAAISVAGAGLTVTLIGSVLKGAKGPVWLAVIEFGLAALAALAGNIWLIQDLFEGRDGKKRGKITTAVCVAFLGMAIGSLSMSVYYESKPSPAHGRGAADVVEAK
jgi:hypothetical protein